MNRYDRLFVSTRARFRLRAFVVGAIGAIVSVQASATGSDVTGGEMWLALVAGLFSGCGYAFTGYWCRHVEPNIGRKFERRRP